MNKIIKKPNTHLVPWKIVVDSDEIFGLYLIDYENGDAFEDLCITTMELQVFSEECSRKKISKEEAVSYFREVNPKLVNDDNKLVVSFRNCGEDLYMEYVNQDLFEIEAEK